MCLDEVMFRCYYLFIYYSLSVYFRFFRFFSCRVLCDFVSVLESNQTLMAFWNTEQLIHYP